MDEKLKFQLKFAALTVFLVLMFIGAMCQFNNWHIRQMAAKDLCWQPIQLLNVSEDWVWQKCK